ncbi:hypothetical protein B0T19DRAFT_420650 [Cercophora scortea]|uniref:Uncharacterized protein n=1 Tax=Cercophora scortea TaxID=314031 RepID=A0AAE0MCD6_9PEZI|nr:hypothetical protein B0T19DRAFT_420650 [Cercophora scortea]
MSKKDSTTVRLLVSSRRGTTPSSCSWRSLASSCASRALASSSRFCVSLSALRDSSSDWSASTCRSAFALSPSAACFALKSEKTAVIFLGTFLAFHSCDCCCVLAMACRCLEKKERVGKREYIMLQVYLSELPIYHGGRHDVMKKTKVRGSI